MIVQCSKIKLMCTCVMLIQYSTGGIIAVMLGSQRLRLPETEALYDRFIDRVFGQKSNIKLVCMYVCMCMIVYGMISNGFWCWCWQVTEQAFYDETELENVLYEIVKDDLMLDSNQNDCCRVFCISTKVLQCYYLAFFV